MFETKRPPAVRVLSIQTPLLGNKTYGEVLRRAYRDSSLIDFQALWGNERREFHARALNRILTARGNVGWINSRNLDFFPARYEFATSYLARRLVVRTMRESMPDVLHFHTQCLALLSTDLIRKIPTVITADRTAMLTATHETSKPWYWTFDPSRRLEAAPLRSAAAVVTFSKWAADSMIAEHGLAPEQVRIIPPGVDLDLFTDIDRSQRRWKGGPKRILFIGGEFRRKNGPLLVSVFLDRFANSNVELHLVTSENGIPTHPRIIVHRGVTPFSPAWRRVYESADMFVMPSQKDALGHVYLEAMAAGLPVIGANVGATPEMIVDGQTGFLVPPNDARTLAERIGTLLEDDALRRTLGEQGRRRVERLFAVKENMAALERVFVDVAKGRGV